MNCCTYPGETRRDVTLYCPNPECRHQWEAAEVHERETNAYYITPERDEDCPQCGNAGELEEPCFPEGEEL